jgi:hypothetical protein
MALAPAPIFDAAMQDLGLSQGLGQQLGQQLKDQEDERKKKLSKIGTSAMGAEAMRMLGMGETSGY